MKIVLILFCVVITVFVLAAVRVAGKCSRDEEERENHK